MKRGMEPFLVLNRTISSKSLPLTILFPSIVGINIQCNILSHCWHSELTCVSEVHNVISGGVNPSNLSINHRSKSSRSPCCFGIPPPPQLHRHHLGTLLIFQALVIPPGGVSKLPPSQRRLILLA